MNVLMMWSNVLIMASGILMFGVIVWLTYRRDDRVRAEHSAAARIPFAMKDELDGPA